MDKSFMYAVANQRLKKADDLRANAGYSGAMHDGGSGRVQDEANAFICGLSGILPNGWNTEMAKVQMDFDQKVKEKDPEYKEFVRLKEKFD